MGLTTAYLITTKNLESFLNALQTARPPERVTTRFLENLDFTSSNDRLFIGVLKGLGFIDESGVPTQRYYDFLDQSQSGTVIAEGIREAYSDLFAINTRAQDMPVDEVKNKLRTLLRGEKSDKVLGLMANTFKALTNLADWSAPRRVEASAESPSPPATPPADIQKPPGQVIDQVRDQSSAPLEVHYNIQIHLPASRDPAVFDAIFQALRRHLF